MSVGQNRMQRNAPPWLAAGLIVLAVALLGYFGWQAVAGREADPGPPRKVRPGMYDLRAEAAKRRAAPGTEQGH